MTDSAAEQTPEEGTPAPTVVRTVAFFADPRAALLLLEDTVSQLVASLEVQRALVDIATLPGLTIAAALEKAGVPYELMDFGQSDRHDEHPLWDGSQSVDEARARAEGQRTLTVGELGSVDANIVLVPAMVGPGEKLLDFTQGSLVGAVLSQIESAERPCIFLDAPERGLRALPDGSYQRAAIHVGANTTS